MISRTRTNRSGFTIPELLVVTVIALILMSILATAHSIGLDALRNAKSQGDLVDQQRMALSVLRRDLMAEHFLEQSGSSTTRVRVRDQECQLGTAYTPPYSGYFKASSRPAPSSSTANPTWDFNNQATWNYSEDQDNDGFRSSRSANHYLQFTCLLPGGPPDKTVTADVPFGRIDPATGLPYSFTGQVVEVAYFLVSNGQTPGGVQKYNLIRRQRMAARTSDDAPSYTALLEQRRTQTGMTAAELYNDASEVMSVNTSNQMLHLNDLTFPNNRMARNTIIPPNGIRIGEDVLLSNVTSFEIKFTGPPSTNVAWPAPETSNEWPRPFSVNTDYPYDNLPFNGEFDTFHQFAGWDVATNYATSSNQVGAMKPIRITGVSIRLRGWDQRTKSTRQTTIIVDL